MQIDAFLPTPLGSTTLSVTAASQIFNLIGNGNCVELNNPSTTVTMFFEMNGDTNAPTATILNSYPCPPGQSKIIRRAPGATKIAVIGSAAGPTTGYVSTGEGV